MASCTCSCCRSLYLHERQNTLQHGRDEPLPIAFDSPVDDRYGVTLSYSAWNGDVRVELGEDVRNGIFDDWFDT